MTESSKAGIRTFFDVFKMASVEPFLFFIFFGEMLRLVPFQSLLMERACRNMLGYSEQVCNNLEEHPVEQATSIETGNNLYMSVVLLACLPAVLVATFLGPWSDKYSRKYPMILATSGMTLEAAADAILSVFPNVSPLWFVAAASFTGFAGGFVISMSGAYSYMSDITDERSRPTRFAILEFASIAAIVAGSLLGGIIFKAAGYLPILIVTSCSFAFAVLSAALLVKDTLPQISGLTRSKMLKDIFQLDNVKQSFKTCTQKRPGNIRLQIWLLVWISCSYRFVDLGTMAIAFPFARKMYSWGVSTFSNANTAYYIVNAFATIALVPILSNKLRLHEAAIGIIGILSLVAKMVVASVAFEEGLFYYACMIGTLYSLAGIAARSRLSKMVNKDESGRVFSLLGTCEAFTPILGTVCFVQIYNASLYFFPALPFAASALFLMPSAFIFNWMMKMPTISLAEYAREEFEASKSAQLKVIHPPPHNKLPEVF